MHRILFLFLLFFIYLPAYAEQKTSSSASSVASSSDSSLSSSSQAAFNQEEFYKYYAKIIDKYVDLKGRVDYAKIKERKPELDTFVQSLKNLNQGVYDSWTDSDKIAFWINIYNALTIKVVVDRYPITPSDVNTAAFPQNSIRQIVGAWTGIKHEVMGRSVTLDEIQNTILRDQFKEPRIYFALSPATIGGPKLRREVYLGSKLEEQLTDQAKYFLRDASKFYLDKNENQILVSPIFDWHSVDFVRVYSDVPQFKRYNKEMAAILKFLSLHLPSDEAGYIASRPLKISFMEYNWELNQQ